MKMKQLVKQIESGKKTIDLSGVGFDYRRFSELSNEKIILELVMVIIIQMMIL